MTKALARDREDRYQSAQALADDLSELLHAEGEIVTQKHVAAMMQDRFAERRQIRDQQMRMALDGSNLAVMTAPEQRLESSFPMTRPEPRRSRRWLLFAIAGVVTLGVFLAVGGLLLNPPPHPRTPSRPAPASTPTSSQKASHVTFSITVREPQSGVSIRFRDRWYPGRSVRLAVTRSKRAEKVLVRAEGHQDEVISLIPSVDRAVVLSLRPVATRRWEKPAPRPKPLARAAPRRRSRSSRAHYARSRKKTHRRIGSRRLGNRDVDTVDPFK
jgi:hypothetical protein